MKLAQPRLEGGRRSELVLITTCARGPARPIPSTVDRDHCRQDVHAGGQAFIDERPGEDDSVALRADRGQDDPDVAVADEVTFFLYFPIESGT